MKSTRLMSFVAAGAILLGAFSASASDAYVNNIVRQLGRGCSNVATGLLEIPANILMVAEEEGDLAAITYGTLRGCYRAVVREVVGVFEIATFPVGLQPIVLPEWGGAPQVIQSTYEPDMSSGIGSSGEWQINRIQRQLPQ